VSTEAVQKKESDQPPSIRGGAPASAPVSAKASIAITPAAVEAIRRQIQKRGRSETALRVGIRGGGCSGFSYVIEFHDGPPRPKDIVYDLGERGDVRVVVDPKSLLYLNGSTLDWEQTLMRQGFKFLNPNEKSSCGCGHSFTV
jgi:iron-sulfur cluster assembly protein